MDRRSIYNLPVFVEKDEGGFYVVECPLFQGCYTQGKTLDEALENIKAVIDLILEEKENQELLKSFRSEGFGLHTLSIKLNA